MNLPEGFLRFPLPDIGGKRPETDDELSIILSSVHVASD